VVLSFLLLGLVGLAPGRAIASYTASAYTAIPVYKRQFWGYPTTTNTIEITNLTSVPGYSYADSFLFVFKRVGSAWVLAAYNDDYGGSVASKVVNVNTTANFLIIVAGWSALNPGYMNVKINGQTVDTSVTFGGARMYSAGLTWNASQTLTVTADGGQGKVPMDNSMLYVFRRETGGVIVWDYDSSLNLQARAVPAEACSANCEVILGAEAVYAGGDAIVVKNGGTDTDGDGLADGLETEIGTSPSGTDSDNDGISDYKEFIGVPNPNGVAGSGDHSLEMSRLGAHPSAKDIFIQVDYNSNKTPNWNQAAWFNSTFTYDQSYTGKSIYVHWQPIYQLPPDVKYLSHDGECQYLGSAPNPDNYKTMTYLKQHYFDPLRSGIFTYAALGVNYYDWDDPAPYYQEPGCTKLTESQMKGAAASGDILQFMTVRGVLEHELGHAVAGLFDYDFNQPRPRSIMNYYYATAGFTINGVPRWSYSNGTYPPLCPSGTCQEAASGTNCDCNEWSNVLP